VKAKKMTPELAKAIEECLKQCDEWYGEGAIGIKHLATYSNIVSTCIGASHQLYSGISGEIRANNYDVFSKRCRVSMRKKLSVLLPHLHLGLVPYILEVFMHHFYLRLTGAKPVEPPPVIVPSRKRA